MSKRRFSATKIARTPSLKRKIAEVLADYDANAKKLTVSQMLAYGHRGYISYDETTLGKLFDKLYSEQLAIADDKRKELESQKINTRHAWEVSRREREVASIEAGLVRFNEIANELFEAKFLS